MRRLVPFLLFALLLGGCVAPVHSIARDPVTGQIEACTATFSVMSMSMKGLCTDGTSVAAKLDRKGSVIMRDRNGAVVTCGPDFNGAMCWPTVKVLPR